jgi:hypothetical protein
MSNQLSSLTITQLRRAADLKEKIDALTKELNSLLGAVTVAATKSPKKGGMSAAGRAKIAAAARARWAKIKAGKPVSAKPAAKAPAKKKGGMSAAGRAKIAAAAKARWAKVKAAGKTSL